MPRLTLVKPAAFAVAAIVFASLQAHAQPRGPSRRTTAEAGPVRVPIDIGTEFLGKSGDKTVVRFLFSASRADLHGGAVEGARTLSFFLSAVVRDRSGKEIETFRVPVDVELSEATSGKPVTASFLRSLRPGDIEIQFSLEGALGNAIGLRAISLSIPTMTTEFRAEDAGTDSKGMPSAAAVVLEAENRDLPSADGGALVKILAPKREVPIGMLRVEAEVKPPVERVEFYLEDRKLVARNRAPYTVELDLGKIPRRQTLKALGFDRQGNFLDADAWAINEKDARLAVRILEIPRKALSGDIEVKVAIQSIAGGTLRSLALYVDNDKVTEWSKPPYSATVPAAKLKKATLIRATAVDEEGKEFSDFKFLQGDSRFMSKVEVNLVELNVTVVDGQGRFVRDLAKSDFTVREDGLVQNIGGFEFAETLPISLGVVIDGSGSMKDSMPIVHEAATSFLEKLIGSKDQGFVMEFRETPTLLAAMTPRAADLIRAVKETRAVGGTALYDSVVMALYQFRAVPGKKAVVVLTDGQDNRSWSDYSTLLRYVRSAGVPIYFIGLGISFLEVGLKAKMNELARDTGGEAFFVGNAKGLAEIYKKIETELRSQYFLSYLTDSKKPDEEYRTIEVKLSRSDLKAKTIRGYFP